MTLLHLLKWKRKEWHSASPHQFSRVDPGKSMFDWCRKGGRKGFAMEILGGMIAMNNSCKSSTVQLVLRGSDENEKNNLESSLRGALRSYSHCHAIHCKVQ